MNAEVGVRSGLVALLSCLTSLDEPIPLVSAQCLRSNRNLRSMADSLGIEGVVSTFASA